MRALRCDIAIFGASLGGSAAALAASRRGARVLLLAQGDWVGGQLTGQGVCTPDENRWIETTGANRSYRRLRDMFREHYRTEFRLSRHAKLQPRLNIGECWVSRLAAEPLVAQAILLDQLSGVEIMRRVEIGAAEVREDWINSVSVLIDGQPAEVEANFYLDASDLGDLLPAVGAEFRVGAEAQSEFGEPHAPADARFDWIQPITFPMALRLRDDRRARPIAKPEGYEEIVRQQRFKPTHGAMRGMFGETSWWEYRRVISSRMFDDPRIHNDIALINTPSNDYLGGNLIGPYEADRALHMSRARQVSHAYLYWLQTECPREDGRGQGYPELQPAEGFFGGSEWIAPEPYVRESRRIVAQHTVREHDLGAKEGGPAAPAALRPDSVGIGNYWLDVHANGAGEEEVFANTLPFQIPLGSLTPIRIRNLLPACKNIGATHLASAAYRLHPIEWGIGEAAGTIAVHSLSKRSSVQELQAEMSAVQAVQDDLLANGAPLVWWTDLLDLHPAFMAANRLALDGVWQGEGLEFGPDKPFEVGILSDEGRQHWEINSPGRSVSRSEAAQLILERYLR